MKVLTVFIRAANGQTVNDSCMMTFFPLSSRFEALNATYYEEAPF